MVFTYSFTFIANIWVLKDSYMLCLNQYNISEQPQFWKVGLVSLSFYLDL